MHPKWQSGLLQCFPIDAFKTISNTCPVSNEIPEWQHPEYRFYISKKSVPIEKSPCCERKSITCLRD